MLDLSASDVWSAQYECIDLVRQLAIHHAPLLAGKIHVVIPVLREGAQSLRSAQCRNALLALSEVYANCAKSELMFQVDLTVNEVLRKCVNDLRFISKTANSSLAAMTNSIAGAEMFGALVRHSDNKNSKMCAAAAEGAFQCLKKAGKARVADFNAGPYLARLNQFETGRSVQARRPAQAMMRFFAAALGKERFEKCAGEALSAADCARVCRIALKEKKKARSRPGSVSLKEIMAQRRREKAAKQQQGGDLAVDFVG